MRGKQNIGRFLAGNSVVIIFLLITVAAIPPSGLSINYIVQEMITRLGRNTFLVLSLLLPIFAGMGLNFGMTLGAMSGQVGLILAINWNVGGVEGLAFAALLGTPVSILMGYICGSVLNKAKGREMVTGYMLAFFINGIYQLVVLYMMGAIIPIRSPAILLSRGIWNQEHAQPGKCPPVPGQSSHAQAGPLFDPHRHLPGDRGPLRIRGLVQEDEAGPGHEGGGP